MRRWHRRVARAFLLASALAGGCSPGGLRPVAVLSAHPLSGPAPLTVAFDATSSRGVAPIDYAWSFEEGAPVVLDSQCTHVFDSPGVFVVRLTVTDAEGRTDRARAEIRVEKSAPIAQFAVSVDVPEVGQWVTFDGSASHHPADLPIEFSWDFGDGTSADGATVGHAYASAGLYAITLTVRDSAGEQASAARNLLVQEPSPGGCGGARPTPPSTS